MLSPIHQNSSEWYSKKAFIAFSHSPKYTWYSKQTFIAFFHLLKYTSYHTLTMSFNHATIMLSRFFKKLQNKEKKNKKKNNKTFDRLGYCIL